MSYNSSIGDGIARINNGVVRKKLYVFVRKSNYMGLILDALLSGGYISGYGAKENEREFKVILKYLGERNSISKLKMVSKPGKRVYIKALDLKKKVKLGKKYVLTTNKGVYLTGNKYLDQGGEVVLEID